MKGLVIHLTFHLFHPSDVGSPQDRSEGWSAFEKILSVLGSGTFESLRELDFSFVDPYTKTKPLTVAEKEKLDRILVMVDRLLQGLSGPHFERLTLHITLPLYWTAMDLTELEDNHGHIDESRNSCADEFWRPVRTGSEVMQGQVSGYWIVKGGLEASWISQSGF